MDQPLLGDNINHINLCIDKINNLNSEYRKDIYTPISIIAVILILSVTIFHWSIYFIYTIIDFIYIYKTQNYNDLIFWGTFLYTGFNLFILLTYPQIFVFVTKIPIQIKFKATYIKQLNELKNLKNHIPSIETTLKTTEFDVNFYSDLGQTGREQFERHKNNYRDLDDIYKKSLNLINNFENGIFLKEIVQISDNFIFKSNQIILYQLFVLFIDCFGIAFDWSLFTNNYNSIKIFEIIPDWLVIFIDVTLLIGMLFLPNLKE